MQVQVVALMAQGRPIPKNKLLPPVEGTLRLGRRGSVQYFIVADFFGGFQRQPPGELWEPQLVGQWETCLTFRGFQVIDKVRYGQVWRIDFGPGFMGEASSENHVRRRPLPTT